MQKDRDISRRAFLAAAGGSIVSSAPLMAIFHAGSVSERGMRFFTPITAVVISLSVVKTRFRCSASRT